MLGGCGFLYSPHQYRGTSLTRNSASLGPYSMAMPRALRWSWGGKLFLMSEVPLYALHEFIMTCWEGPCRINHEPYLSVVRQHKQAAVSYPSKNRVATRV